jgi:S-adenosylmethionine:tRNA-ribosyltransferase-isomerase (queuine synthetase)
MRLSDFDYELPKELIAQFPPKRRDESRLMVLDRDGGDIRETHFSNFPRFLQEGDILVVNETRVIPARIFGRKKSGGLVEVFLVRRHAGKRWVAMLRPADRLRAGETVLVGERGLEVAIGEHLGAGHTGTGRVPRTSSGRMGRMTASATRRFSPGATAPSRRRPRGSISRKRCSSTPGAGV